MTGFVKLGSILCVHHEMHFDTFFKAPKCKRDDV